MNITTKLFYKNSTIYLLLIHYDEVLMTCHVQYYFGPTERINLVQQRAKQIKTPPGTFTWLFHKNPKIYL